MLHTIGQLQSELQTVKDMVQSTNVIRNPLEEELALVKQELQAKEDEISRLRLLNADRRDALDAHRSTNSARASLPGYREEATVGGAAGTARLVSRPVTAAVVVSIAHRRRRESNPRATGPEGARATRDPRAERCPFPKVLCCFSSPLSFGGGLRVASDDAAGGLRLEGRLPGDRDVERAVGGEGGSDRERGSAGDGRGDASRRGSGADTANAGDPLRT